MRILAHEVNIVEIDELVAYRLAEHQSNRQQQETADRRHLIAVLGSPGLPQREHIIRPNLPLFDGTPVVRQKSCLVRIPKIAIPRRSMPISFSAHVTENSFYVLWLERRGTSWDKRDFT